MSTLGLQTKDPAADGQMPPAAPNGQAQEISACWNTIGGQGDASCPQLQKVVHCHNCPVHSRAGAQLLDRPLFPGYRREWTEHYARAKERPAPANTSALLFRVNAEWLALPTLAFQEVAERRPVHSLPHRHNGIVLGLVNVRGELLICVSLSHLLGLEPAPLRKTLRTIYDRLLVVHWDDHRFVFPVEEVRGIHRFHKSDLMEPPAILAKSKLTYTQGILHWRDQTVGFLDADLLFSSINGNLT